MDNMNFLTGLLYLLLIVVIYFIPSLIAIGKKHLAGIFFLNAALGWTLIAWIACFIWACVDREDI